MVEVPKRRIVQTTIRINKWKSYPKKRVLNPKNDGLMVFPSCVPARVRWLGWHKKFFGPMHPRIVHSHILNSHIAHGPSIARLQMWEQTWRCGNLANGLATFSPLRTLACGKPFQSACCSLWIIIPPYLSWNNLWKIVEVQPKIPSWAWRVGKKLA